jgi:putative phosphoesterase
LGAEKKQQIKMKIGVLSDTHLTRVTNDFRVMCEQFLSGIDLILHAGDFVSPEVAAYLGRGPFHGVFGNMDPSELRTMMPGKKIIEIGGFRLGLIHGMGGKSGIEDRIRGEFPGKVDAIVYGHSHRAANAVKEGVLFFNPGTTSPSIPFGIRTLGILELNDSIHGRIIEIPR